MGSDLLLVLHASVQQFRTGWFVESVVSAAVIVLVIRTRHPFFKSRTSPLLLLATAGVTAAVVLIPYIPWLAGLFGFAPLPPLILLMLAMIVVTYVACAELVKKQFYRMTNY
jgi:P-type Mg2+ transporter